MWMKPAIPSNVLISAVDDTFKLSEGGGRTKNTRVRWGNINPLVLPTGDRVVVRVFVKSAVELFDSSNQSALSRK